VEGWLVKVTGDGIMASFEGPGRRIQCALALREGLRAIGTEVRIGLHTGEIELRQEDIGGLTVHVAARVMAEAEAGEVLVSETIRDLVAGSDVFLEDKGMRELKGVEGKWRLFALTAT